MRGLYYQARAAVTRAADRFGNWCDAKTEDAYRHSNESMQRATRQAFQTFGSAAHAAKLIPRFDACRLESESWTAVWVGDPLMAGVLERLLFPHTTAKTALARVPVCNLTRFVDAQLATADVVVCALPRIWPRVRRPAASVSMTCPVFVGAALDIAKPLSEILAGTARKGLRQGIRISQQARLNVRVTSAIADLEHFHARMYRPHIQRRFGDLALLSSLDSQQRRLSAPGGTLLLLETQDGPVAGILLRVIGSTCFMGEEGVAQTPEAETLSYGLRSHLRLSAIEYAQSVGARTCAMGGSLARCGDPALKTKLQWGGTVVPFERALYPEWTFLVSTANAPLRDHLNGLGLITFSGGRPCVISMGPPSGERVALATKIGRALIVDAGAPDLVQELLP